MPDSGRKQAQTQKQAQAQVKRLTERLARLSEASLRISESLDVNTVLQEVVASACALTGAGFGGISTTDAAGQLREFVTHGLSPEEHRQLLELPGGARLWDYLREVSQPLRLENLSSHLEALGLPRHPVMERSLLGMPVRHQGAQVGYFYLLDKAGEKEFAEEDGETLSLFAAQAGAAIANARTHRDEQQARADLEALIDTSPVGVVVLDARSGRIVSHNRESRLIMGDLCVPGRSLADLIEVVRVRRADGREISLDESTLVGLLREAAAIRAEEILVEDPDGRKVTVLINATPIVSEAGEVASVVVTMQDMTPLEELERQRAEFLSVVSHELRTPLASIKGCATTALGSSSILHPAESQQFFSVINAQADHMSKLIGDLMDAAHIETGSLSVSPLPVDLTVIVDQARNIFLSGGHRISLQIELPEKLPRVRVDQQRILQVLGNLLSNAARHSPESGAIRVEAAWKDDDVVVSVIDEGVGIAAERLPYLFRKYAGGDGRGLGSGLGLAICKGLVEAHGGRIWAQSEGAGMGTRVTFTLPSVEEDEPTFTGRTGTRTARPGRPGDQKPLILVVDDDPQFMGYIRNVLEQAGFDPLVTGDPEQLEKLIEARTPDLLLLDLMLPGTDGIEVMRRLQASFELPVIFLSAFGRDDTIARALEHGAADYIVKPFSDTELTARIKAALRRHARPPEPYRVGDLVIDYDERRVVLGGRQLNLTVTEFNILEVLSTQAGRAISHDQLLKKVWQSRNSGDVRVVRAMVKKIRRKLGEEAGNLKYIFTESRVGYRMPRPG